MTKLCRHSWIVIEDENDKIDAVEQNHTDAEKKIKDKGYKILGYPAFNKKGDAIWYIKSLQPAKRKTKKKIKRKL